jgi:hypothetical protein
MSAYIERVTSWVAPGTASLTRTDKGVIIVASHEKLPEWRIAQLISEFEEKELDAEIRRIMGTSV